MGKEDIPQALKDEARGLAVFIRDYGPVGRAELAEMYFNDGTARKVLQAARMMGHPIVSRRRDGHRVTREYVYAREWAEYRPFRNEMISRIRTIAKVVKAMDAGMKHLDPAIVRLLDETEEHGEENE